VPDIKRKYPDFNPFIITLKNEDDRSKFWEIMNYFMVKNDIRNQTTKFARDMLLEMEESSKRQG